jgi:AraC-like DNA-binding protein
MAKAKSPVLYAGRGSVRTLPAHRNPGLEIVVVLKGTLVWQAQGRAEVVPAGWAYFTLPWQEHGSTRDYEPGHEWCFAVLRVSPTVRSERVHLAWLPDLSKQDQAAISSLLSASRRHAFPASPLLRQIMPELVAECASPGPFHRARLRALSTAAVVELARSVNDPKSKRKGTRSESSHAGAASDEAIRAMVDRVARECHRPWTLSEMASSCGLGRTRFSQLLARLTGDTPITLMHRLRVERARVMLRETDLSVTQIAQRCGFVTSQYFARVFGAMTGRTPRDFRSDAAGSRSRE